MHFIYGTSLKDVLAYPNLVSLSSDCGGCFVSKFKGLVVRLMLISLSLSWIFVFGGVPILILPDKFMVFDRLSSSSFVAIVVLLVFSWWFYGELDFRSTINRLGFMAIFITLSASLIGADIVSSY